MVGRGVGNRVGVSTGMKTVSSVLVVAVVRERSGQHYLPWQTSYCVGETVSGKCGGEGGGSMVAIRAILVRRLPQVFLLWLSSGRGRVNSICQDKSPLV